MLAALSFVTAIAISAGLLNTVDQPEVNAVTETSTKIECSAENQNVCLNENLVEPEMSSVELEPDCSLKI